MRDAFGGTFMIQILLVFIIIYVGFIGIAINYGRAFRIKNYVIEFLEESQISSLEQSTEVDRLDAGVKKILTDYNYKNSIICDNFTNTKEERCIDGVIIQLNSASTKNGVNHVYYTVNTYIGYNMGFLNSLLSLGRANSSATIMGYFKISGETKVIVTN